MSLLLLFGSRTYVFVPPARLVSAGKDNRTARPSADNDKITASNPNNLIKAKSP